jgi:hypothetical protein
VQATGICNIFNKIIAEYLPNLGKELPIQVQETPGHKRDLTKLESQCDILSLKRLAQRTEKEY